MTESAGSAEPFVSDGVVCWVTRCTCAALRHSLRSGLVQLFWAAAHGRERRSSGAEAEREWRASGVRAGAERDGIGARAAPDGRPVSARAAALDRMRWCGGAVVARSPRDTSGHPE